MKIATLNVNGVNGRLSVVLRWLAQAEPDVLCLQELKAPQDKFPEAAIRERLHHVPRASRASFAAPSAASLSISQSAAANSTGRPGRGPTRWQPECRFNVGQGR
jgi:exonuclease III